MKKIDFQWHGFVMRVHVSKKSTAAAAAAAKKGQCFGISRHMIVFFKNGYFSPSLYLSTQRAFLRAGINYY
jgi:hypothetical protein